MIFRCHTCMVHCVLPRQLDQMASVGVGNPRHSLTGELLALQWAIALPCWHPTTPLLYIATISHVHGCIFCC